MSPSDASLLTSVSADYWSAAMERYPTWATAVSIHDHDSRLEDLSPEALAAWQARLSELLVRVDAIQSAALSPGERVTLAMLRNEIESGLLVSRLGFETWSVDQLGGPQVGLLDLVRVHVVSDAHSAATWLARVRAMPAHVDQHCANLARGLAAQVVAPKATVARVLEQLSDLLAAAPESLPLVTIPSKRPDDMSEGAWATRRAELIAAVATGVLPAFARYAEFLRTRIEPAARSAPGLCALPGGLDAYQAMIVAHTALPKSPEELHETGLKEMARIRGEMLGIVRSELGTEDLGAAFKRIREEAQFCYVTREEIVESARVAVRRATLAARECFDLLPDHECDVKPVDAHAEKSSAAAFYLQPAPDGSRPGTYYVNTSEPTKRTRLEAEAVAYHEAVPGHHLQIALAQKIEGVPEFQKHVHSTAYVEGWALYTERLADELGLYSGPLDRLGMLSCDALRACRLVVDTGLHAFGWSRERAIEYMAANTTSSMVDICNEIDRYIAWPGQAVSYKVGQLEILRLRTEAQVAMGSKFRLGAFHRVVLESGGIVLPVLEQQINAWMRA